MKQLGLLQGHTPIVFSPDGKLLALGREKDKIQL